MINKYLKKYNFPEEVIKKINDYNIQLKFCRWLFFTNGLTIFPVIYVPSEFHMRKNLLNHELIHIFQQRDQKRPIFSYLIESLKSLSYRRNKFEIEAYNNENNFEYILKMQG